MCLYMKFVVGVFMFLSFRLPWGGGEGGGGGLPAETASGSCGF